MPRRLLLAVLFLQASAWTFDDNGLTAEEKRDGWILLFDGNTANGWTEVTGKPFGASWRIEDHSLRAFNAAGGNQDIRTAASFHHFELRFDWKLAHKGNSGVKYFVQRTDEWTNTLGRQARGRGFEYQLATEGNPDAESDPSRSCASLYSVLAPSAASPVKAGVFHHSRILIDATHVEHWLDGVKVLSYRRDEPAVIKLLQSHARANTPVGDSPIVLQNHSSDVWFRNLKLRPLD